ncbi:MFS transporter [Nonomuraea soli]|uniref:MFS transporter n=1 Tax=Nonomuraea soli TaxID=1032476 RepID=UPI0028A8E3E5|nr:MFS transporter [Nonomuraea soli]
MSSLLAIWSITSFVLEIPSGVWADVVSRRKLMACSPLLMTACYALWTFAPGYPAFAAGFVCWGAASALRSGAWEALVYQELAHLKAERDYARVIGRAEVASTMAVMLASALAAPALTAGGYPLLGILSLLMPLVTAGIGWSLPESRRVDDDGEEEPSVRRVITAGLRQVRHSRKVRQALILLVLVYGLTGIDEYLALLADESGASPADVALLIGVVTAGEAVGGWLAGRGLRWERPLLVLAGLLLALGAILQHAVGFVPIAAAFAIFRWAVTAADARLQERIEDTARATVTSLSGFGTEVVVLAIYAGYGLGSHWLSSWQLFVVAAVPYVILGLARRS